MIELLDFEEHYRYMRELERWNFRDNIHKEDMKRNAKKNQFNKFKQLKFGKKPIG